MNGYSTETHRPGLAYQAHAPSQVEEILRKDFHPLSFRLHPLSSPSGRKHALRPLTVARAVAVFHRLPSSAVHG
jgi:hypothetical protein